MVKVGGMCWVINTGARSIAAGSFSINAVSACGPPVEEPISSARGDGDGERPQLKRVRLGADAAASRTGGAAAGCRAAQHCRRRGRAHKSRGGKRPRPRVRIFSISSRRNAAEVVAS